MPEEGRDEGGGGREIHLYRPWKKKWHFHSLTLINFPERGTGWMRVIFFPLFTHFPSPFLPHSLSSAHTHRYTHKFLHSYISKPPPSHPSPRLFPSTPPSESPEGARSSLTSQPAWQQPINYEWQVFGPIKAPPYFMHSKSDCRLLWRVADDMFIVVMAWGGGWGGCRIRECGEEGLLPNIRVSKALALYRGQTDGNSGMQGTPSTHPTTPS